MTSPFNNALRHVRRTVQRVAGVPIKYQRGATTLEFDAVRGQSKWESIDESQLVITFTSTDWLFPQEELAALDPPEPVDGDLIIYDDGQTVSTFKTLSPDGEKVSGMDNERTGHRLHSKLWKTEPSQ